MGKGYCIETRDGGPPQTVKQSNGALTFEDAQDIVVVYWMEIEKQARLKILAALRLRESDFDLAEQQPFVVCTECPSWINVGKYGSVPETCPGCKGDTLVGCADLGEVSRRLNGRIAERYYVCLQCVTGIGDATGMRYVVCGGCGNSNLERMKDVDEMYTYIEKLQSGGGLAAKLWPKVADL